MHFTNKSQANRCINASLLDSMGRSRGVALITAMLITALVAIAAAAMAERQQLDIRRTENLIHGDQAMIYAFTAESIVSDLLLLNDSKNSNTLEELELANTALAVVAASIPIEGGGIAFKISDMSGSFPLNRLVDKDKIKDDKYYQALKLLLADLEWHDEENNKIVTVSTDQASYILDWIDQNTEQDSPGAEDSTYLSRPLPYRTANQPLVSLTELRLMAEMTNDEYNLLANPMDGSAPKVNVLPGDAFKINVNTASREVLMNLYDGLNEEQAEEMANKIMEARESDNASATNPTTESGITNTQKVADIITEVLRSANASGTSGTSGTPGTQRRPTYESAKILDIDIISTYFQLTTTVGVGRSQIQLISLLKRDATNKTVQTIRRGIGIL